jgi:hypothetical protein
LSTFRAALKAAVALIPSAVAIWAVNALLNAEAFSWLTLVFPLKAYSIFL